MLTCGPRLRGDRPMDRSDDSNTFLRAAIEEARAGLTEGGIPIGSVLVIDGRIVGRGHNRRVQKGSAILHAEMDAIENAGRLKAADYRRAVIYSTPRPCDKWSGTAPRRLSGSLAIESSRWR